MPVLMHLLCISTTFLALFRPSRMNIATFSCHLFTYLLCVICFNHMQMSYAFISCNSPTFEYCGWIERRLFTYRKSCHWLRNREIPASNVIVSMKKKVNKNDFIHGSFYTLRVSTWMINLNELGKYSKTEIWSVFSVLVSRSDILAEDITLVVQVVSVKSKHLINSECNSKAKPQSLNLIFFVSIAIWFI